MLPEGVALNEPTHLRKKAIDLAWDEIIRRQESDDPAQVFRFQQYLEGDTFQPARYEDPLTLPEFQALAKGKQSLKGRGKLHKLHLDKACTAKATAKDKGKGRAEEELDTETEEEDKDFPLLDNDTSGEDIDENVAAAPPPQRRAPRPRAVNKAATGKGVEPGPSGPTATASGHGVGQARGFMSANAGPDC